MARRKLDLQNAKSWENLPDVWKVVKRIKPIDLYAGLKKDGIKDKGLLKIVEEFINDDALRLNTAGLFVDDNALVCTDTHKLICIPSEVDIEKGLYSISPKVAKKVDAKLYSKIDGKFPDYKAILPEHSVITKVDAYKLKTYVQAVVNGKYENNITHAVCFKVENDFNIGFNSNFLIECLESFLLMGYNELYFGFSTPSRGITISPNENTAKNSLKNIGKHPFVLLMPVIIDSGELGARDVDYGTGIDIYFSFIDNEIYNADGSIANYDGNLTNTDLPYIDSDSFSLINKLIPKNPTIPMLEYVKVKDSKATITDLDFFLEVKDVFVEDGMYAVCNGAFKDISDFNIDDFPMMKTKEMKLTQIATLDTNQFAQRTKEALPFLSDDDLRPVMECLSLRLEQGNITKVSATNGFTLFVSDLKDSKVDKKDLKLLIRNPKLLSNFLGAVNDNSVKVFAVNIEDKVIGRLFFETDNFTYSIRLEDGRTPDYEAVIRRSLDTYLQFNTAEMIMAINSLKGEDAKKTLYLDFNREEADGFIKLKLGENKYGNPFEIVKDLGIKIPYHVGKSNMQYDKDIAIIMSINTNDNNFAFNPKLLKSVLSVGDKDDARLNFDSKQEMVSMFISELRPIQEVEREYDAIKKIAKVEIVKETPKKATKEEVMIKIDALQILADMGDKDAENNIEILKLLL